MNYWFYSLNNAPILPNDLLNSMDDTYNGMNDDMIAADNSGCLPGDIINAINDAGNSAGDEHTSLHLQ